MESLRTRDWLRLLDVVGEIRSSRDPEEFRSTILASLPRLIPCEINGYNEVDTRTRTDRYWLSPADAADFPDSVAIFNQHIGEHPLISYHAGAGSRSRAAAVVRISDLLSRRRFHRLGLYCEFFRRIGIEHQMACALPRRGPMIIGIALNRRGRDFTERERALLEYVRPHLALAYERAELVAELRQAAAPASTHRRLAESGLSNREIQVLALVGSGKSNPEAGLILGISARTVQKHLEHVFGKLGVNSRTAAAARLWCAAAD
jgi:DNA-binding CsgD family transcriptional regulator